MFGGVAPEGVIQMSLIPQNAMAQANVSRGHGTMVMKNGEWSMQWQGTSGPDASLQYTHWAYMTQARPGMPMWDKLPVANMSVETLLAQCPKGPPKL